MTFAQQPKARSLGLLAKKCADFWQAFAILNV